MDKSEFIISWQDYIKDIYRLKINTKNLNYHKEIDRIRHRLNDIVEEIAKEKYQNNFKDYGVRT